MIPQISGRSPYCRMLMRFADSLTWQTTMHRAAFNAQWLDHPTHRNALLRDTYFLERSVLTYDFRLPPGPRTVEYALLAEALGFRAVWCPKRNFRLWPRHMGTLARIAEKTKRLKFGPSVLIPSYRHPMAQASAIATLEQIAPGRLMVGFGTGFTAVPGWARSP